MSGTATHLDGLFSKNYAENYDIWSSDLVLMDFTRNAWTVLVRIAGSERPFKELQWNAKVGLKEATFQVLVWNDLSQTTDQFRTFFV